MDASIYPSCNKGGLSAAGKTPGNKTMSTPNTQKTELLMKTADFYRRSIANYKEFTQTERKPRTKKRLEQRLQTILKEIDSLKLDPVQLDPVP
jgi:hypothetical protein